MARISLAREADCKPAVAGFDSQARLHGPWSRGLGSSFLRSRRAFESRRADGVAHVDGTTEYSFPVRIWLVLRNQSAELTCGFKSRIQPEHCPRGGLTALGRAWCAGGGYFAF